MDPSLDPTTWTVIFVLSNIIQLVLVTPRILSFTSGNYAIAVSYVLGVLGDICWHVDHEQNAIITNIGSLYYMLGTLPCVFFFFAGQADGRMKLAMAALFILNIYTFSDPKDTTVSYFLENHAANHLGSTLFYYVVTDMKYRRKEPTKED
mmetsp:Transcript_3976/g.7100  ORF Transcript_3976/g.7100 Transcript_3976/m.7100 type:complete len:150 (+) Transcript_3976:124-573(+)